MMAVEADSAIPSPELPVQSAGFWRSVVASVPDMFLLVDNTGRILYLNHPPAGVDRTQVSGTSVFDYVMAGSRLELLASLRQIFAGAEPRARVLPGQHPDGSVHWYDIHTGAVRHEGAVVAAAIVARDVTRQRQLEERVRQGQKLDALGQLAGGIAHDFNNILTIISSSSQLLLEEVKRTPEVDVDAATLRTAIQQGSELANQLLTFARRQKVHVEHLDLNLIVGEAAAMVGRLLGPAHTLTLCLDPAGAPVRGDRTQLGQVLMNLLINARDAMPVGGTVTITTSTLQKPQGRCVRLRVQDTGEGMDDSTRERLFEPFFTTKPAGKGTGLGLSTVYMILNQLGGCVEVASVPGVGSTFDVFLPRADATS